MGSPPVQYRDYPRGKSPTVPGSGGDGVQLLHGRLQPHDLPVAAVAALLPGVDPVAAR